MDYGAQNKYGDLRTIRFLPHHMIHIRCIKTWNQETRGVDMKVRQYQEV
jgi:hypothetical protein